MNRSVAGSVDTSLSEMEGAESNSNRDCSPDFSEIGRPAARPSALAAEKAPAATAVKASYASADADQGGAKAGSKSCMGALCVLGGMQTRLIESTI
jgi:hypothetical protein